MIFYFNTGINLILPFIFWIGFLLFWISYKFYSRIEWKIAFEKYFITCAMIFIFFMFSVINVCAQFLNCSEISGKYYVTNYLNENCNNSIYIFWKWNIVLPSFLLFSLIIPGILLSYLFMKRETLFHKLNLYKTGFLLNGYKRKKFYW